MFYWRTLRQTKLFEQLTCDIKVISKCLIVACKLALGLYNILKQIGYALQYCSITVYYKAQQTCTGEDFSSIGYRLGETDRKTQRNGSVSGRGSNSAVAHGAARILPRHQRSRNPLFEANEITLPQQFCR